MRFLWIVLVVACGGSTAGDAGIDAISPDASTARPSCTEPRCSADPKPNDNVVMACQNIQASKCGDVFDDWARCVDTRTACDVSTKTTDPASRVAAFNQCKPKFDALQMCCNTNQVTCPTTR